MSKKTNTTPAAEPAPEKPAPTSDVTIAFVKRENGPERLVAEAELLFNTGLVGGMKLVGFSVWQSSEGELYVTFPSRAFGAGGERRFFDFLRSVNGDAAPAKALKQAIVEAYKAQEPLTAPVA